MNEYLSALPQVLSLLMPLTCIAVSCLPFSGRSQIKLLLGAPFAGFIMAAIGLLTAAQTGSDVFSNDALIANMRFDFLSSCLLPFIFLINLIVVSFSDRYLAAEKMRVSFIRHCCLLALASAFLLCSDNLFLSLLCWHLISIVLYLLVLHSPKDETDAAIVLSHHIASDLLLAAATVVIYSFSGEACISQLKNAASATSLTLLDSQFFSVSAGQLACFLLLISFSIKSALFPFHKWLLCTLQAPTPLSGLLHAGVVNVSAIMAFRLADVFSAASHTLPVLWGLLALISALAGTLSMSAQFDVKRKLVYSTVGQMGFMCLQCALGAYSAAIFHLVAHGFFKCYLFLQSGSAVAEGLVKKKWGGELLEGKAETESFRRALLVAFLLLPLAVSLPFFGGTSACSIVLALLSAISVLPFLPSLGKVSIKSLLMQAIGLSLLVLFSAACACFIDKKLMPAASEDMSTYALILLGLAAAAIGLHFLRQSSPGRILYVHALNGFYIDEIFAILKIRFGGNLSKKSRIIQEVEHNAV